MNPAAYSEWRIWSYDLPLVRPLFWGGNRLIRREGLVLGLLHPENGWRYGEAAPLPGFTAESLPEARASLLDLMRSGLDPAPWHIPCAAFAFSSARHWGGLPAGPVALNGLAEGTLADITRDAERLQDFATVKVKCGVADPQAAAARVGLVAEICGGAMVRADANRLFAAGDAATLLRLLEPFELEYVEEPCRNPADLPALALEHPRAAIALDETTRESADGFERTLPAARALVLKPSWSGDIARTAELLAIARRRGLPVTVSSALESGIGLRNLAALVTDAGLAAACHGLDTGRLLAEDVLVEPPRAVDGRLEFPSDQPDLTRLKEIAHGHHPLPPA